jgi:hypothetical protein
MLTELLTTLMEKLRMSAEPSLASVTDLTQFLADARDRQEFAWLFDQLAELRASLFEPPSTLLPSVFDELDRTDRFAWAKSAPPRWIAYAGGLAASAAGALVIATRTRRAH